MVAALSRDLALDASVPLARPTAAVGGARRPRALFICGSLNQTTQLHAVARQLPEWDHRFTPYYGGAVVTAMRKLGLIEMTIGGERLRRRCLDYLDAQGLPKDLDGAEGGYDLVVTCTDLVIPDNVRGRPIVAVQEGILDPPGFWYRLVRALPFLPRWLPGTALTGLSGLYTRFCCASEGYRQLFIERGADPDKLVATGMPNFDDCRRYYDNDFPHKGYVLVCTSDTRETFKKDDRPALWRRIARIAAGRQVVVKLHPNENVARSTAEIHAVLPEAKVYSSGSAEEMIANSDVLVTQWSSTVFVGLALGKEIHSYFDRDELERLVPLQNGGTSARAIADVCRDVFREAQARSGAEQGGQARQEVQPWPAAR